MEKVKYRYNRWRLALGRLVNLRYINRWIIFCADLFISLCVSLIGVLGLLSIMHVYISGISVLKVGIASFVASILSFLTFKVYHGVIRHSTLRGLWRIGGVAITKSILMFILLHLLRANFNLVTVYRHSPVSRTATEKQDSVLRERHKLLQEVEIREHKNRGDKP